MGKTAAFVLPMVVHCMAQRLLEAGEGPIAVILAPTRELAEQIHKEAKRFAKPYGKWRDTAGGDSSAMLRVGKSYRNLAGGDA